MSKAEKIHYKAVIAADNQEPPKDYCISAHADHFNGFVEGFVEGYHQAEEDLEPTLEDIEIIINAFLDLCIEYKEQGKTKRYTDKEWCQEVLKRFKELKK